MSVNDWTKEQVLNHLKASRKLDNYEDNPVWRRAFALYNVATGSRLNDFQCSKCYNLVKEWLEA